LAAVFLYHGFHKIADIGNEAGLAWARETADPPSRGVQLLIAWGEMGIGAMMAIGFLTRVAAALAIATMIAGIYATHSLQGWTSGDNQLEYHFLMFMICIALLISGGGPYRVAPRYQVFRRRAVPVASAVPPPHGS
jgi:uncharacterized membrane protein YphA (DoxX/SURF4 family)